MSRHLTDELSAYVDRRPSPPQLLLWDRHVVVCQHCRYAVDEERRILTSLREGPVPQASASLHAMLLQLASQQPSVPTAAAGRGEGPGIPRAPWGSLEGTGFPPGDPKLAAAFRLPTVSPRAPAHYRSLRRTAVVVGLVAGASAAATWTFGGSVAATTRLPGGATASLTNATISVPARAVSTASPTGARPGAGSLEMTVLLPPRHTGATVSAVNRGLELP